LTVAGCGAVDRGGQPGSPSMDAEIRPLDRIS
jgi:hypothetical protein